MNAAALLPNGKTTPGDEKVDIITFDKSRFDKIKKVKRLVVFGYVNTTGSDQKTALWIYSTYGIGLKLGAILKLKRD